MFNVGTKRMNSFAIPVSETEKKKKKKKIKCQCDVKCSIIKKAMLVHMHI